MITLQDYQFATAATAGTHVDDTVELLNWTLGVIGECGELVSALRSGDVRRIAPEAGDVWWYLARFSSRAGLDLRFPNVRADLYQVSAIAAVRESSGALVADEQRLLSPVCDLAEQVKKLLFSADGDPRINQAQANVDNDVAGIQAITAYHLAHAGLCLGTVLEGNLRKLQARHPKGFIRVG